jgi:hypothetical protein
VLLLLHKREDFWTMRVKILTRSEWDLCWCTLLWFDKGEKEERLMVQHSCFCRSLDQGMFSFQASGRDQRGEEEQERDKSRYVINLLA